MSMLTRERILELFTELDDELCRAGIRGAANAGRPGDHDDVPPVPNGEITSSRRRRARAVLAPGPAGLLRR
jgi:hypothetical protein